MGILFIACRNAESLTKHPASCAWQPPPVTPLPLPRCPEPSHRQPIALGTQVETWTLCLNRWGPSGRAQVSPGSVTGWPSLPPESQNIQDSSSKGRRNLSQPRDPLEASPWAESSAHDHMHLTPLHSTWPAWADWFPPPHLGFRHPHGVPQCLTCAFCNLSGSLTCHWGGGRYGDGTGTGEEAGVGMGQVWGGDRCGEGAGVGRGQLWVLGQAWGLGRCGSQERRRGGVHRACLGSGASGQG